MTMGSLTLLFLISPLLTHLTRFTIAQPEFPFFICSDSGNYTSNSSYRANLDHLLSSFSFNTEINYGFYNFSAGEDTDKVYAIALCRGDVTVDTCRSCVNNSTHQLIQFCPNQKEAIVWYEKCMLRYSDQSIFGAADLNTPEYTWLGDNITNTDQFNQELGTLLADLKSRAASGGSLRKFASGEASVTSFQRIYALLQCTPDLNELACENCLQVAIDLIPNCCDRKPGGYIFGPSCNLRWEKYSFFPSPTDAAAPQDPINRARLDWETRCKIIGGIARGLLYLHEDSRLRIIHRDLKSSNILLDAEMNPKISDFGMARLFLVDQTQDDTSRIVGTYGYMAPEYAFHGNFSVKSDVYSFGVLVLEIVSGQKNNSFRIGEDAEDLKSYAWKNWMEGTLSNLIDPTVKADSRTEIMRCIHIGLLCVQENVTDRPTMASVVQMLNSDSSTLPIPSRPAYYMYSSIIKREMPLLLDQNSEASPTNTAKVHLPM